MEKEVIVVGAGLAGSEAAYQLAKRGIKVKLYEMKAKKKTPAHSKDYFSELVCSNSLGSDSLENASGLMKEELRILASLLIEIADKNRVPAGQALAVDRDGFSEEVTKILKNTENIEIIEEEFTEIPDDKIVIIASGPLTSDKLFEKISEITGEESLYFYDAAAPIVTFESIDMNKAYFQSRYGKGYGEYINCPMNKEEYYSFYNELIKAERAELKNFEKEKLFDACMPIEKIAMSGEKTMTFGPLKPKGLINPKTEKMDYAVVQLRQDDKEGKLYNIVGFQTNLKFGEQKRVFSMIPGLENAEFIRYGVMHRNTFINSTKLLDKTLKLKNKDNIYFAGQITGGEGYVTAIATGMYVAMNVANRLKNKEEFILEDISEIGAIVNYITEEKKKYLNSSFAIDNYDDREEYNRKHAEITGGKEQDGSLNTQGSAQGVDTNGNRTNTKTKLDYKGTQTTSGTTTQRFKSDYQMKKTNGRALDESYFNDFIEASTMFLGMNLPTNDQIVYDNNGYYDDRTGGNSSTNAPSNNNNNNNSNGSNPGSNRGRTAQNLLNRLGATAPSANGILPSSNGVNNRHGGNTSNNNSWWNKVFGGGSANRLINNPANNNTLWGKIQNAGVKASEVLEQVIGYGRLTGALLDDLVDLGALKKNPLEKALNTVDKASNTLRTVIQQGLVSGQRIEEIIKTGGSKGELVAEILKATRVTNKLSDWIEKKTGIRVDILDDRIPTNYPDNTSIEDMVEDMRRRGLVLNDNALNINSAAAQAKTGLSAEQINERVANALGIKVKSSTPKSRRYFLG